MSMSTAFFGMQASASSTKERALKSYKKLLAKKYVQVLKKGSWYKTSKGKEGKTKSLTLASNVLFKLAYLDNDNVPELVVKDMNIGAFALYRYNGSKAVKVAQGSGSSKGGDTPYYYYSKAGLLYIKDSKTNKVFVYYFNGKKLTVKYVWYLDGKTGFFKSPKIGAYGTYSDGNRITYQKYCNLIDSYLEGKIKKKVGLSGKLSGKVYKLYYNTTANRKKIFG